MSPFEALQLPNGQIIANRIAKAAMEENMADINQAPSRELKQLYKAWADRRTRPAADRQCDDPPPRHDRPRRRGPGKRGTPGQLSRMGRCSP